MKEALKAGKPVILDSIQRFVDGASVKRVGDRNFEICKDALADMLLVPEGKVSSTILQLYNEDAIVAEPAGALSIAALDQYATQIKGKKVVEAQKLLEAQGFEVEVQDSVFFDTVPPLTVMKQLPMPGEMVKVNRTIYLTVNRVQPPLVVVPNFMGQTFRSVEMQLKTLGFKLGDTTFRPDFAVGSILEQLYNGVPVRPGTSIPMGSRIDLVLGSGLLQEEMPVPALLGMTFTEAKLLLEQNGLLLGAVVVDGAVGDSSNAFVIKQHPPMKNEEGNVMVIRGGQIMDLWISMDKEKMDTAQLRMMPPKTDVISQE
jgi:beta-lactam-binding protein with PASTA domain